MIKGSNPQRKNNPGRFLYRGASMRSTFISGQYLYTHPLSDTPNPGDVVVYRKGNGYVVHRVKKVLKTGIVTRGDNNPFEDDQLVSPTQLVGVVKKAGHGHTPRPVQGGRWGLFRAQVRWKAMEVSNRLLPVIGAPYRWLKKSRLVPRIWHPAITMLQVHTQDGLMIKYINRGKTVATWLPELRHFHCKRIFDLVILPPSVDKGRYS